MNNEKDFTKIYHLFAPKVKRLCLGYASGNQMLAEEWLQETFIKVWNHRKSFQNKSSIETWIFRIAVNTCLADLRRSKIKIPITDNLFDQNEESTDEKEQNLTRMYNCIHQLSTQNKTLVFMELENIPQATIAETLGVTHGSLRTRLSRIKKSLLKCIENGK